MSKGALATDLSEIGVLGHQPFELASSAKWLASIGRNELPRQRVKYAALKRLQWLLIPLMFSPLIVDVWRAVVPRSTPAIQEQEQSQESPLKPSPPAPSKLKKANSNSVVWDPNSPLRHAKAGVRSDEVPMPKRRVNAADGSNADPGESPLDSTAPKRSIAKQPVATPPELNQQDAQAQLEALRALQGKL
jgi:hypothetical protein